VISARDAQEQQTTNLQKEITRKAYERQRGRSRKLLAPFFVGFVGIQGDVLDVACGTGALTFAIAKSEAASKIVAIGLSEGFSYASLQIEVPGEGDCF